VADDARHLDLVHCENQRRRRTGLTQNEANIRKFGDRRTFAAERGRHHDAEQPLLAQFVERLGGKAGRRIHRRGMLSGRSAAIRARAV